MDAVEFIIQRRRMFAKNCITKGITDFSTPPEEVVAEVEKWSATHPQKTRQDVFLEQYPDVSLSYGIINIKPCQIVRNHTYGECCITDCPQCRKEFWTQEVG